MLKSVQTNEIKANWEQTDTLLGKWLQERQELIVLFCAVDGLREYTPKETPVSVKLNAFCQVLIDYMSAWHFEISDKLIEEATQFNDDINSVIVNTLEQIQQSTSIAVDFNDNYTDRVLTLDERDQLSADLSRLGEHMVERFDLEDQIIELMHNSHKTLVA